MSYTLYFRTEMSFEIKKAKPLVKSGETGCKDNFNSMFTAVFLIFIRIIFIYNILSCIRKKFF